jgi:hypothetical protein
LDVYWRFDLCRTLARIIFTAEGDIVGARPIELRVDRDQRESHSRFGQTIKTMGKQ